MSCRCYHSLTLPDGVWVGLLYMIVIFPGHTRLLFQSEKYAFARVSTFVYDTK